ncbi:MAG: DUF1326 domain-containing protein [Candidatus Jettenia sp.]|nr:MAG: DUF1326 domain-containing protein [Candidatus Jettenia sp.]
MHTKYFILVVTIISVLWVDSAIADKKWSMQGVFVEGCSCKAPCPCELIGLSEGCNAVGVVSLSEGNYMGADLAGAKIAYAVAPSEWVRIYVDGKSDEQREAAIELAKGMFSTFGEIESTSSAHIDMSGMDGSYTVRVNDGKLMQLTTEPVLGGDNKTPITHTNIKNKFILVFMQGRTIFGSFHDGERKFELKGGNSYFNNRMESEGTFQ